MYTKTGGAFRIKRLYLKHLFKIVSAETEDCIWQSLKNMYCFSCSYVPLQYWLFLLYSYGRTELHWMKWSVSQSILNPMGCCIGSCSLSLFWQHSPVFCCFWIKAGRIRNRKKHVSPIQKHQSFLQKDWCFKRSQAISCFTFHINTVHPV